MLISSIELRGGPYYALSPSQLSMLGFRDASSSNKMIHSALEMNLLPWNKCHAGQSFDAWEVISARDVI
jgi:hypothetical protein